MAKKIIMIAPFDVLTGNLSGQQSLQYAENNNPAYEAPNGSMGARNYKTRYVGARRADGTTYFSVRQKNTAVLNGKTRTAMGLTAVTALIISACKKTQTSSSYSWAKIQKAYDVDKQNGTLPEGVDSVTKFANYYIRRMLQYKQEAWSRQSASSPLELHNPYDLASASAISINLQKWIKFASLFAFAAGGDFVFASIDGKSFLLRSGVWKDIELFPNLNYLGNITNISVDGSSDPVLYFEQQVYLEDTAVKGEDTIEAAAKYTTIAPEP